MTHVLSQIQRALERLHDVETELDVMAYLVDDTLRREIPGAREGLPEQLFVREAEGDVEIALYIDPMIVAHLEQDDPMVRLHEGNLEPFCVAVEGVSHFVFLVYRALLDRPVTALELEIQAEVDKFVQGWLLLVRQGVPRREAGLALARRLFGSFSVHEEVCPTEEDRYRVASQVADVFCRQLNGQFGRDDDSARLKHAVRAYYRTGLAQKVQRAA